MEDPHFDRILGPVAAEFSFEADTILDLRTAALQQKDAGECLRYYFKIHALNRAKPASTPRTQPLDNLREWLERNLEIVARDHTLTELERLPVSIFEDDLESFCRGVMREFQENRDYPHELIEISLAFKAEKSDAA